MKVAIVGCGKIADQHIHAIARIPGSEVVAVCDREPMMAQQLAERFGLSGCYEHVDDLLRDVRPAVVHLTSPPHTHHRLAVQCLEGGANVYIEKPFAVAESEASDIVKTAIRCGRRVTVGHNYQFTAEMHAMRRLVSQGYLGGPPTHMESHWTYDLSDASYVGPLLGSPDHWVRKLPGKLLQNIVSHGLARIVEQCCGEIEDIAVIAGQSSIMRQYGSAGVTDELRVLMRDSGRSTAEFCFSTQIKPGQNTFRLYGPKNSIQVDVANGSMITEEGRSYKSYLTYLLPHVRKASQYRSIARRNLLEILRWRLYQDFGMADLIGRFHQCIRDDTPVPIPYREILLLTQVMDRIFSQIPENADPPVHDAKLVRTQ